MQPAKVIVLEPLPHSDLSYLKAIEDLLIKKLTLKNA
jgi:hypothetical protein